MGANWQGNTRGELERATERTYPRASLSVRAGIVVFRALNRALGRFPRATTAAVVLVPLAGFGVLVVVLVRKLAG